MTGYYPVFSEKTRNDFVMRAVARRFFKAERNGTHVSTKEMFERLTINSRQWYVSSNNRLAEAVRKVNEEAGAGRISFARIEFPPEYTFAAPQTHLWGLNRSPFRMMTLLLSFGKVLLPSNDQMRSARASSCSEIYKRPSNETSEQKKKRKSLLMLCRYAALGHPNKKGAVLYADAITDILKSRLTVVTSNK